MSADLRVFAFERVAPDELRAHVATNTYGPGCIATTACGLVEARFECLGHHFASGLNGVVAEHIHGARVLRCDGCGLSSRAGVGVPWPA
jgi:hypothetical protein